MPLGQGEQESERRALSPNNHVIIEKVMAFCHWSYPEGILLQRLRDLWWQEGLWCWGQFCLPWISTLLVKALHTLSFVLSTKGSVSISNPQPGVIWSCSYPQCRCQMVPTVIFNSCLLDDETQANRRSCGAELLQKGVVLWVSCKRHKI